MSIFINGMKATNERMRCFHEVWSFEYGMSDRPQIGIMSGLIILGCFSPTREWDYENKRPILREPILFHSPWGSEVVESVTKKIAELKANHDAVWAERAENDRTAE